ncbi:tetratricopeptide repeat-containing glycosyltransferase family protein [Synechococcus sp. A15-28]|uniref:tetratricopeptide repeat-containing glycosyltransferase family protein n=1 Tax=Synechococcus sp. A15-28 TaxID=1050638 RepID=UPI0016477D08|nr:tetratricopeptide repeat-containing glycosyltransferase family protein [Synechococcus sp. A15-28]QNI41237.1 TPR repeat-containing protein [Synechococcus sp. A15-28]
MTHSLSDSRFRSELKKAVRFLKDGNLHEAEVILRELASTYSQNIGVIGNLACIYIELAKYKNAIRLLEHALALNPNSPKLNYNIGLALLCSKQYRQAIHYLQRARNFSPQNADVLNNLGLAFQKNNQLKESIHCFRDSLEVRASNSEAHNNLGVSWLILGEYSKAFASFKTALKFDKLSVQSWSNLGIALKYQGKFQYSIYALRHALKLFPHSHELHYNYALSLFSAGNYREAWQHFAWRDELIERPDLMQKTFFHYDKLIPSDSSICIFSEQGLGDTLQFSRYFLLASKTFSEISFCIPPKLSSLLKYSGFPRLVHNTNTLPSSFYTYKLLDLPSYYGASPSNAIISSKYLKTPHHLVDKWRSKFAKAGIVNPIIGINWSGNRLDLRKKGRDFPAQNLIEHCSLIGLHLVFLQRVQDEDFTRYRPLPSQPELKLIQEEIYRLADSDCPDDFLEYASVVCSCDLIITSATTLCHLAGGLGVPTWTLLQKVPDWRWGAEEYQTGWYESMRLFRQRSDGDWASVIEDIKLELSIKYFLGIGV